MICAECKHCKINKGILSGLFSIVFIENRIINLYNYVCVKFPYNEEKHINTITGYESVEYIDEARGSHTTEPGYSSCVDVRQVHKDCPHFEKRDQVYTGFKKFLWAHGLLRYKEVK